MIYPKFEVKKLSKNIKGFIFDLDGVITDTAEYHYKSWKRMAEEEAIAFDRKVNEQLRGVSRMHSLDILLNGKELSLEKKKELASRKNKYYQDFLDNISQDDLLPGMSDILKRLQKENYKIAVASSSKNAKIVLKYLEIDNIFDTISDGNSVKNAKPAPDIFLYTADKINLKPEECVVVEDAESGIEAALAANMTAVGIGPEERVGKADFRYDKTSDINLDEILKKS